MLNALKDKWFAKVPVADVETPAKLIADLQQRRRITGLGDLMKYRDVQTKQFGLQGNDLSAIAVLNLGQLDAAILVADNCVGQRLHLELRQQVKEKGYTLTHEYIAAVSVLVEINGAVKSKQTTFLERGFALCPPEGGTPSGPS